MIRKKPIPQIHVSLVRRRPGSDGLQLVASSFSGLRVVGLAAHCFLLLLVHLCDVGTPVLDAQTIPEPNCNGFGYPFPPPPPGEPGVTPFRRYILDGEPHLRFRPRPQDEIWQLSTRGINPGNPNPRLIKVARHDHEESWQAAQLEDLFNQTRRQPDKPTIFFFHGHRTEEFWGDRRGKQAYQALFGNCPGAKPVRFVIWSWPSDPEITAVRNFQDKNERALFDGCLLGWVLTQLDSGQEVSLIGYSLGTQVVLSGMEHVASNLSGPTSRPYNIAAVAPVTHCQWPQHPKQVEKVAALVGDMVIFKNSRDRVLAAYQLFCRLQSHTAKCRGIDTINGSGRIMKFDVAAAVGTEHNFVHYISNDFVRTTARRALIPDKPRLAQNADDKSKR